MAVIKQLRERCPFADMKTCKQALTEHGGDVEAAAAALAPKAQTQPAAAGEAAAPPVKVSEAAVERLQQLGFEEARCREALLKHGGDETKAEDWLLNN